ncbi:MAG: hypothetical protein C5B51_13540 [Terriglobia bacterium]|nr:MAG: hypothetical protein C5B51_13540 [Terriglobia bacterium]
MSHRCFFVTALVSVGVVFAQTIPVGPSSTSSTLSFGVLGLASGETLRINVLNNVRVAPPVLIAQTPCKIELDLYDNEGKLLKQKIIDNLNFGKAEFLDLDRAEVTGPAGRIQIAAAVKVGSNQAIFCSISPTIEVYDNMTGRASTVISAPVPSVIPRSLMIATAQ